MRDAVRQDVMVQVLWYWVPVALYAGFIFFMSAQSHPEEQLPSFLLKDVSDKVLHAVEYAVLGVLCYRGFRWGVNGQVASRALLFAIVTASLYGMTDEAHQLFVPFRESSWQDWLADTIGAAIGVLSWRFLRSE
ncbi:MAG: VanZ family protein [Nitrospiraceae bacterium]